MGSTSGESKVHKGTSQLYSQAIHVPDRPFNCHGEAGVFRSSSYEAGSDSLGSRCLESTVGSIGGVRLSPRVSDPPGNLKVEGSGLSQDDPHCSRMAKHALVLGPSESVSSDSVQAPSGARPGDSTLQRGTTQESQQSQSSSLAPRISAIQEYGFSDEVAARIEAPQRSSTRAVYKSKWSIFLKWCQSHEVDVRAPSVNQIADFFYTFSKKEVCNPVPLRAIEPYIYIYIYIYIYPTLPAPLILAKKGFSKVDNKKRKSACPRLRITPARRLYSPLANEQDTTGPGQSPAQDVFF